MSNEQGEGAVKSYRLGCPFRWHTSLLAYFDVLIGAAMGVALMVGAVVAIARTPAAPIGWLILALGMGACTFTVVAVSRLCLRARIWPEGILTLRWIVRRRSFDVLDVTGVYWRRPKDMVRTHPGALEPFEIEVRERRIRVEAVPWAMLQLADELRSHNPSIDLDLPELT